MSHTLTPMSHAELQIIDAARVAAAAADDDRGFGCLRSPHGSLPLAAMEIDARVVGLVATVELAQTFVNGHAEPIEAIYVLPLPDRAAVTWFRFEVAGRVIDGVMKEREEAQREYGEAIAAGHRAALAEEERPGVFSMRVGNLMPGERAVVRVRMTGPLPIEDGDPTFCFPLVVAPRYMPGAPLPGVSVGAGTAVDTDAVPDASRISPPVLLPGMPSPVRLGLRLTIDPAGLPLSRVRSSLHAVTETTSAGVHHVALQPGERLDRDFIVRFALGDGVLRSSLVIAADGAGGDHAPGDGCSGTFMLTLVPPAGPSRATRPRDVVFVLDRSGSMGGWKMVAARRAVARMVDTLTDRDRFAVMAFDDSIEWPAGQAQRLTEASDRQRFRAVEFLAAVEARGGTELGGPLIGGAELLAGGYQDRDRMLVLVTDGQVGNEDQILHGLAPRLKNVRVFTLGIDRAVNAGFLRRLAAVGGGSCALIESEDRLDEVMDAVHRRIGTPVVTELRLTAKGGALDDATLPARLPALFAGAPVTIFGRYRGGLEGLALGGLDGVGTPWQETLAASAPGRDGEAALAPGTAALQAMWARGYLRDLEDRYILGKEDRGALERRIVQTSVRCAVLSRFTAFVAVDRSERVNPGGGFRTVMQPVELPDGWATPGDRTVGAPSRSRRPTGAPTGAPSSLVAPSPVSTTASVAPRAMAMAPTGMAPMMKGPMAPPAPAAPAKMMAGMSPGGGAAATPPHEPDLAPYVERLRALREQALDVASGSPAERLLALLAGLRVLDEDLRSIEAPAELLRELGEVMARLRAVDRGGTAAVITDAVADAGVALAALLAAPPTGAAPGRRPFWKIW